MDKAEAALIKALEDEEQALDRYAEHEGNATLLTLAVKERFGSFHAFRP